MTRRIRPHLSCSAGLAHSNNTELIAFGCLIQILFDIALYRQGPKIRITDAVDDAAGG